MELQTNLKAYMGYSRCNGRQEGAVLIFANDRNEAHTIGFHSADFITDEFTDFQVELMKDVPHLFRTEADDSKLSSNIAHVINSPTICKDCEIWGYELGEDGLCFDCRWEREHP
jgi:hypothetical protein